MANHRFRDTKVQNTTNIEQNANYYPQNFSLSLNYPNPFNPSTKILYSVPKSAMVKIEIFNSLGKIDTTLVNKLKPPGNYSVEFETSKY